MENWVIWHDNGVLGQEGYSDGYRSEAEAMDAAKAMDESGILVYRVVRG